MLNSTGIKLNFSRINILGSLFKNLNFIFLKKFKQIKISVIVEIFY